MSVTHAGYDKDGRFTTVTGDFTVPRMECGSNSPAGFVAVWIGIQGGGGLEQCGVSAWCSGSERWCSVWYENYPDPPYNFTRVPVAPGDRMHGSVEIRDRSVVYVMKNLTQGGQETITTNADRGPGVREWLAEARGTPPPFAQIDFWLPRRIRALGSIEGPPFNLGPVNRRHFWIRDRR